MEVRKLLLEWVSGGFVWVAELLVARVAEFGMKDDCAGLLGFLAGVAGLSIELLFLGARRLGWRG